MEHIFFLQCTNNEHKPTGVNVCSISGDVIPYSDFKTISQRFKKYETNLDHMDCQFHSLFKENLLKNISRSQHP